MANQEQSGGHPRGAILLLAAGEGRRFGRDKRRAVMGDGRTVLEASYAALQASGLPILLCLRASDRGAAPLPGAARHFSSEAARGMGATLASGARQMDNIDFLLVALGDMPWLHPDSVCAVADAASPQRIVVPTRHGQRGHPVAFGADFLPALRGLDGDRGARDIVARHSASVHEVALEDPGILRDVDQPQDLCDARP